MIWQSRSWAHIQTKLEFEKIHHPNIHSSTIHNSQDMNGLRRCGTYIQWDISLRKMKQCHLQRCGWTWR